MNDYITLRLSPVRDNDAQPADQGITKTQKLEIFGLLSFFTVIFFVAVGVGMEVTIATVLDLLGTANAAFLVLTSYRRDFVPKCLRARHKAIVLTGLTVIQIPTPYWIHYRQVALEVPIAIIGLGGYLTITGLSIAGAPVWLVLFFVSIGVAVSVKLMDTMFRVIRISCPFCVFSAGTMTTIFLLTLLQM
ncbi:MAG: vitamin K epoxide reductase family protein [Patescibacteria group bacterium]|jgi:hypothetical protein